MNKVPIALSICMWIAGCLCAENFLNLEDMKNRCVLETKQIKIPHFPGAFNASLIRWKGKLLLCFRVRNAQSVSTFEIGLVWLDERFNPNTQPQILRVCEQDASCFERMQDPRLFIYHNKLYMVYSNFVRLQDIVTRRMFLAEVKQDKESFFIERPLCLHPFAVGGRRWEKNWVPFIFHDKILLLYSLNPLRVLTPSLETGICTAYTTTHGAISWQWGELRGGTPAVRDGDEYLAFFHSSCPMATVQSSGKKITHYVMGAYTFSAKPPFHITRISPQPLVGKNFYVEPYYTTWKPLRVVFPMGCVFDGDYIWLTYGRQDFEIWVAKIDKKLLYESLAPVAFA